MEEEKIILYNMGLYETTGEVGFCSNASSSSYVLQEEPNKIRVVKLDDIVDLKPTYIKLDIEGVEKRGALRYGKHNKKR